MGPVGLALRNGALLTLMLGHFTNDMLGGVLPILLPEMKERFDLSNARVGLVALAYTGMASLTQPLFGWFSDRHGRRWYASAALLWGASFVALYGYAPSFGVFVAMAALAGIASGAYHPLGASNAAIVADDRARNVAMSFYTVGGTSGYALGPVVAVGLLALFGVRGTTLLLVPGVAVAALLFGQMRLVERARAAKVAAGSVLAAAGKPAWGPLGRVMVVAMLRSWVFLSVVQFAPLWYDAQGYGRGFYGPLVTTIILAGAVGTLLGGALADRLGQRRIVVVSLALAIPALFLFAGFPGRHALLTGALFGLTCDASLSVTLVMAQKLVPGRIGVTSGVVLGLGFITGGIGVPITGRVADATSIPIALASLGGLFAVAVAVALTIPREVEAPERPVEEVASAPEPLPSAAPAGAAGRR